MTEIGAEIARALSLHKDFIARVGKMLAMGCARRRRCPVWLSWLLGLWWRREIEECYKRLEKLVAKSESCLIPIAYLYLIYAKLISRTALQRAREHIEEIVKTKYPLGLGDLDKLLFSYVLDGHYSEDVKKIATKSGPYSDIAYFLLGGSLPEWCKGELKDAHRCTPEQWTASGKSQLMAQRRRERRAGP